MKKILIALLLLSVLCLPYFLPLPLVSSGWHSQYELGDTMSIDLAAWNIAPFDRTIAGDQAGDVTIVVDGTELAVTPTDTASRVTRFSRVAQSVSYTIDKTPAKSLGFDPVTGAVKLPPGPHDIQLRWLGSSTWPHRVTVVQL